MLWSNRRKRGCDRCVPQYILHSRRKEQTILMHTQNTCLEMVNYITHRMSSMGKCVDNPLASQYLLLVLYNVQAYINMLFRVTC